MAEGTVAVDPAAGSAEHPADFCADWQPGSVTENSWKSARMADGQAKNAKTAPWRGQKDACCGKNGLNSIGKVLFFNPTECRES